MRNAPETRASLILRLRNHQDLTAWQEFAEIYHPLVFRLARSKGFQHTDSLDIAQEVLVRVAGAIERWDPATSRGSFRGWLYRISRNLMVDFLERGKRQPDATGGSGHLELVATDLEPGSPHSQQFDDEFRRQVFLWAAERIRSGFAESTWQAFWLTAIDQVPPQTAADQLQMSVGAVYVARSRVMQRLKQEVQRVVRDQQTEVAP